MKFSLQNKTAIHNETNKRNVKSHRGFWLELPLLYATELCGTFCKPPCWPLWSPHPCTLILSFSAQLVTFSSCGVSQSVASNNISSQISFFLNSATWWSRPIFVRNSSTRSGVYIHVHSTVGIVCLGRDDKESVGEWKAYPTLLVLTKQISAKASILGSKGAHTEDGCMFAAASEPKGMALIFP